MVMNGMVSTFDFGFCFNRSTRLRAAASFWALMRSFIGYPLFMKCLIIRSVLVK